MLHLQECLRLFSASLKLLLHEGKCPQDMHRRRRTWALTSCSHGRFWVTKILQKCDTEEEVSLGMGWNSLWSVFLFLPLSVLMVPEYELFAKIRFKDGRGLPWWRSGWESACWCGGHGFEPWSGRIPYAAEQLGPWATITEPARLEPVLRNKRGRDSERPAHRDEEWPPLATTRESPHRKEDPYSQK